MEKPGQRIEQNGIKIYDYPLLRNLIFFKLIAGLHSQGKFIIEYAYR